MILHRSATSLWCSFTLISFCLLIGEYRFIQSQTITRSMQSSSLSLPNPLLKNLAFDYGKPLTLAYADVKHTPVSSQKKAAVIEKKAGGLSRRRKTRSRKHLLALITQKAVQASSRKTKRQRLKKFQRVKETLKVKKQMPARKIMRAGIEIRPTKAHAIWAQMQREPLFSWPVEHKLFYVSSLYGPRRKPNGVWGFHAGIDMAAPRGTPVYAAADGLIVEATYSAGYGNYIMIAHNRKFKTRYAHLDKILVTVGEKVASGDCIGRVGATGYVRKSRRGGSAAHLHFEVYMKGKAVNPFYFLA